MTAVLGARNVRVVTKSPLLGPVHAMTALQDDLAKGLNDGIVLVFPADVPMLGPDTLKALVGHRTTEPTLGHDPRGGESERPYGLMRVLGNEAGEVIGLVSEKDASRQQRAIRECTSGVFACTPAALARGLGDLFLG